MSVRAGTGLLATLALAGTAAAKGEPRPSLVVTPSGGVTAVWVQDLGRVVEATRPSGDGFGPVRALPFVRFQPPTLAVSPRGDLLAGYTTDGPRRSVLALARRPAGSAGWTRPERVAVARGGAGPVQLAGVTALWMSFRPGRDPRATIWAATRRRGGWGRPVALSPLTARSWGSKLVAGGRATSLAVWSQERDGVETITAAEGSAKGTWGAPRSLSAPGWSARDPHAAGGPRPVVVWERQDVVQARVREDGRWAPSETLSAFGAEKPQVAEDSAGRAIVVWNRFLGGHYVVESAHRGSDGRWSPAATLAAGSGDACQPQVAMGPTGAAAVVWTARSDGMSCAPGSELGPKGRGTVWASVRSGPDAPWSAPQMLSSPGRRDAFPTAVVDGHGTATAAWTVLGRGRGVLREADVEAAIHVSGRGWTPASQLDAR